MAHRGFERRREDDPERTARDRAEDRGDHSDDRAVGQQHEPEVFLSRPDCREHAELAEPTLRDDGEARGRNERGQEQEDGGDGEHCERVRGLDLTAAPGSREARTAVFGQGLCKGAEPFGLASTRTVTFSGAPADEGEMRANSSLRSSGFSMMPTTVRRRPSRSSVAPSSTLRLGHTLGDRDLTRPCRVAASAEREEIAAVGPIRVLRAEVHRLNAAGHRHLAVSDDVRRPERLLG